MWYMILLLLILIIGIIGVFGAKKNNKYINNKTCLIVMFVILLLFAGLRDSDVGSDALVYKNFFQIVSNYNLLDLIRLNSFEIGFKILTKFCSLFCNYNLYIFIITFISLFGFYFFIKKYSNNYLMSIFLFIVANIYIYLFCTIRQTVAISILLVSIKYVFTNEKIKFILLVLLAASFHKTALIFMPVYLLKWIDINKIGIKKIIILYLIIFIFKRQIVSLFINFFYSSYNNHIISGGGYFLLLILIVLAAFIYYFVNKKKLYNNEVKLFYNIYLVSILFQILATSQGYINRITLYFMIPLIILLPKIIQKNKFGKYITYSIYIIGIAYYIYNILGNSMYNEYHTLF